MKKEFGKWILDITKYLVTVGILAPALKFGDDSSVSYYLLLTIPVILMALIGFYMLKEDKETNKKKGKKNK